MEIVALSLLTAVLAATPLAAMSQPAAKGPPAYVRLPETSHFVDGVGIEGAQLHCLACHSADYVNTQPRGMPEAFWTAEVAKMRTAYGATMTDDDAKAVVKYLTATYGAAASPAH